jgi:hypothetical protein
MGCFGECVADHVGGQSEPLSPRLLAGAFLVSLLRSIMIYKLVAILIAGLFLFPCIAKAESEPMYQRFEALSKVDANSSGRLTGILTTVCAFQKQDRISTSDMSLLLNDYVQVYRNTTSNEAVEYSLRSLEIVNPDCYKHLKDSN